MKISDIKVALAFALIISISESCSVYKNTGSKPIESLPPTFINSVDTANVATMDWRKYFPDSVLVNLIDTALSNNFDLLIVLQRIEMAHADVRFSKGLVFPYISVYGNTGLQKFGKYTMDGAGNNGLVIYKDQIIPEHLPDYSLGLQTSWEIDLWDKLNNRKKAAVARFLGSIEAKNLVVTTVISDISYAYYELLALDNEYKIINETILLQEKALEYSKVQKQAGALNELAVKQFEAQLLNSNSLKINILQQISECENKINLLIGRYPRHIDRDSLSFSNPLPGQIKVGIPANLLQNRPDIRQAELEVMASKADTKAAKAAFYPSLNINGTLGFQSFQTNLLFKTPESLAYGILGSLTSPLINRSAIKAEFTRANAAQMEALYNYQKTVINGYVEVYNEIVNIKNLEKVYELKTLENNALTSSVEISYDLFRTGRANYLEVLIAQQKALDSNMQLINAKKMQFDSMINIYKSLGGGWE
jgi:outer membrane protein, multidrug efflux system